MPRLSNHYGRSGKNGVYSAKHNDRNFRSESAKHIDETKENLNKYWQCYPKFLAPTFEECEQRFYAETFGETLAIKNEKAIQQRHRERIKTTEDLRASEQTCVDEVITQLGNKDEFYSPEILWQLCQRQKEWEEQTFPQIKILDMALHMDETTPHVHKRFVYVADTPDGKYPSMNKALTQMGIERPNLDKPQGRYNNPKMTYTEMCRNHLLELCKEFNLSIELEPKEPSQKSKDLLEFQIDKMKEEQSELVRQNNALIEERNTLNNALDNALKNAQETLAKKEELERTLETAQKQLEAITARVAKASLIKKHWKDDTVEMHKNSYEGLQELRDEFREDFREAKALNESAQKRFLEAERKEKEVNPLYEKASALKAEYERKMDRLNDQIEQRAKAMLEEHLKAYGTYAKGDKMDRALSFMEKYSATVNGEKKSLRQIFAEQERQAQQKIRDGWRMR